MSARRILAGTALGLATLCTAATAAPAVAAAAAPVPVTALNCDGDTGKCTANLKFGDGKWTAVWGVSVSHQDKAAAVPAAALAAAPVPVTALNCDGDTGKCTANLKFGDGKWIAVWAATISHQDKAAAVSAAAVAAAPVPTTALNCDGDTGKCTANLKFGDGKWIAVWAATISHQG